MKEKSNNHIQKASPSGRLVGLWNLFLTALMFYTRIPVKWNIDYSPENLNKATRFFPFIGLIVGGIGALVFWGASFILPLVVAVILSTAATIFTTGAFHEDGFADFCDGFGGGYTKERIITIMKDSRIGTYGSAGLLLMLLTKIFTLFSIDAQQIPLTILAAHSLSRVMPVLIIFTTRYVRDDETSKIKPIGKKGSVADLISAILFGSVMLLFFPWIYAATIVPALLIITLIFRKYITRKIGGYTGDCLGALQQISEVGFYLGVLIISR
jgi:adenosylcobinamide-GDP ribazoletransferase